MDQDQRDGSEALQTEIDGLRPDQAVSYKMSRSNSIHSEDNFSQSWIGTLFKLLSEVSKFCVYCIPIIGPRIVQRFVQILVPEKTQMTTHFSTEIARLCKDFSYKCILCNNIKELCDKYPLAVVCPVSSRFEPDIDLALNGIKWKTQFAVLLLHSGLENSLPRLPTASKLEKKEKYHNVEFIDVAYNLDSKLYTCQMNETANYQLHRYFTRYYRASLNDQRNYFAAITGRLIVVGGLGVLGCLVLYNVIKQPLCNFVGRLKCFIVANIIQPLRSLTGLLK